MYRQSEKYLLNSNTSSTCPHNMANLQPTSSWDRFGSFLRPSLAFLYIGSITARQSAKLCGVMQVMELLNFRMQRAHLYSAWRLSHWALGHILVMLENMYNLSLPSWMFFVIFYLSMNFNYRHQCNWRSITANSNATIFWIIKCK